MGINSVRLSQRNLKAAMENAKRNNDAVKRRASCKIDLFKNTDQPIAIIMVKGDKYSLNTFVYMEPTNWRQ